MPNYIASGVAQGIGQHIQGRDVRQAQRETAKSQQELAGLQLEEFKATAPVRQSEAELRAAQAQQAAYTANSQLLGQQTYDSINRYEVDKDPRHFNTFLEGAKRNPMGAKLYGNIVRVDKLSSGPRSTEVDNLLRQAGYNPEDVYASPEIQEDLLLSTNPDGSYSLMDVDRFKAATGYQKYATDVNLAQQEKKARIKQMMRSGQSHKQASQLERVADMLKTENKELTTVEALKQARNLVDKTGSTADERMIQQIMDEQDIPLEDAMSQYYQTKNQSKGQTNESRFIDEYTRDNPGETRTQASEAYANRAKTATDKNVDSADDIRDSLDEMNYLDTPESELTATQRSQVNRKVQNLIKFGGVDISGEEKKTLRNLKQLTEFGYNAGEITSEETGVLDKMFNNVKAYMSDEIGGKEATSAYESLRNVLRHELFGATVPEGEMEAFNAAIGTLGQQTGPVLTKLRTQLGGMRAKLAAIRDMNDQYVIKHMTGMTQDKLDDIIDNLDNRINSFKRMQGVAVKEADPGYKVRKTTATTTPVEPGAPKPSLDDIFGGL